MGRVAVIIVNYRTSEMVEACLRTLVPERAAVPGLRVVIVDNQSRDDSLPRLERALLQQGWSDAARLLPLAENRGFAAGNNAALRVILAEPDPPDYLWLLNPDTEVRPGALAPLLARARAEPRVGIVGSRLEFPDGTPQRSAFRFPSVLGEWENGVRLGLVSRWLEPHVVAPPVRPDPHPVDWLSGASLLLRREVVEQVGWWDEGFFLYFEEVDYCRRAARQGWQRWYEPASRVVHHVSASTGVDAAGSPQRRMPEYWFASRRRYFGKHLGRGSQALADLGWMLGRASWRVRRKLQGKPEQDPAHFLYDFIKYNWFATPRSGPVRARANSQQPAPPGALCR